MFGVRSWLLGSLLGVGGLLWFTGCGGDSGGSTGGESATTTTTAATAEPSSTDSSSGDTSGGESESEDAVVCASNPPGEWNACKDGPLTMNSRCNWTASAEHPGAVTCLVPTGGGASVCTIEGCEEDCDCFARPSSGDATVACVPVFAGGVKGCILQCSSGETCPDGMECRQNTGTCYWPNT